MKKLYILSLLAFIILSIITSCVENVNDAGSNIGPIKVTITSPKDSSTIPAGRTEIIYSVQGNHSPKFVELYFNNVFLKNFPTSGASLPKVFLDIDTSNIGRRINFHIVYYDNNGSSLKSNVVREVLIQKAARIPSTPYDINLVKLGDGTAVNISWKDSLEITITFEIHRKIGFKGTYSLHKTVAGDVRNVNDIGLNKDSTYFYRIRAVNLVGTSPFSKEVNSDNLFSSGTLEPPTNLIAQARGTKVVLLTWKDNSTDENYFAIERKSEWTNFSIIARVLKNVTYFRDTTTGLFAGGNFSYRIKAFSNRDSAHSNVSTTTTYPFDLPAPTNLRGEYNRNSKIVRLEWNNNDTQNMIRFFEIERSLNNNNNFVTIGSIPASQTTFSDSTTQANRVYYYRVVGLNDKREYSEYSNEIAVSTY